MAPRGDIVTRDRFPKEVVSCRWLGNPQSVDLDVCEWNCFLRRTMSNNRL